LAQSVTFIPRGRRRRPRGPGEERWEALRDALTYPPSFFLPFRSRELLSCVTTLLTSEGGADWLFCDTQLSGQLALRPALPPVRRALCLFDVYSIGVRRKIAATAPGPFKVKYMLDLFKVHRYESRIVRQFDLLSVVSDTDRRLVTAQAPRTPVVLVPGGVDTDYFRPCERTAGANDPDRRSDVLFVGNLAYEPNEDGIRFFLARIWPHIRRAQPRARLVVGGKAPPAWLQAVPRQDPSVMVTGPVADVRPLYRQARVAIAPLRLGAGTKLKVVEALAMGVPVVATPQGYAGLNGTDGQHLLVGSTPEQFAAHVIALLDDDALAGRLAAAGRTLVEQQYDWTAIMTRFEAALRQALGEQDHQAPHTALRRNARTCVSGMSGGRA